MVKKIRLYNFFNKNIVTRESMTLFFSKLRKINSDSVLIDFENIEFISRSCADEYLKQKERINKEINEVNQSREVKSMLEAVSNPIKREIKITEPRLIIYL